MAYFVNKSFAPEMKEYSFCKAPGPPGHFLNPVVSLQLASCVCKFPQLLIQPTTGGKYSGRKKKNTFPQDSGKIWICHPGDYDYLHNIYIVLDVISNLHMV